MAWDGGPRRTTDTADPCRDALEDDTTLKPARECNPRTDEDDAVAIIGSTSARDVPSARSESNSILVQKYDVGVQYCC